MILKNPFGVGSQFVLKFVMKSALFGYLGISRNFQGNTCGIDRPHVLECPN